MATPRIYIDTDLKVGARVEIPEAAARHVLQVLRMREAEALVLFNGQGGEYGGCLHVLGRHSAAARIETCEAVDRESQLSLCLAQCVSKGERMEVLIQKAVELGVGRIEPLLSARSVVKLDAQRWEKKAQHWRGVIVSACEQSGRTRIPELAPIQALSQWLQGLGETAPAALRLVLAPGQCQSLKSLPAAEAVTLLIGPEGGLTDTEVRSASHRGFRAVSLGPRILRTETAGIAAIAAIQALWGDAG